MILKTMLNPDAISIDHNLPDKHAVLHRIAEIVASEDLTGEHVEVSTIVKALEDREALGSTGFGHGVAIPHCRLKSIDDFSVGFVFVPEGVDFNSVDGENAYFFPFVVGPEDRPKKHLSVLSALAQLMRTSEIKKEIEGCNSIQDINDIFSKYLSPEDENPPAIIAGMKLIHVFIQDESLFDEILQIFSVIETTYTMVVESHESTDYLRNISLFADFWNTDIQHFNRIIIAVVRDELIHATIRNIEYICGDLSKQEDVLITITDLRRVLGSLSS
ncbi:MAG: PTS sugar transporter subunit IIA [Candidatus Fermentibacteraceae bacterium]|nr:PTS sugar transporter subunit IIA [Candidatus Fermentibacteraceae bacterium]